MNANESLTITQQQQHTLLEKAEKYMLRYTTPPSVVMKGGGGCYLYSAANEKYLDFLCGWGSNILGHCHPSIVQAIKLQANKLCNAGPGILNETAINFAAELCSAAKMDRVYFCNIGTEANENAVKLARKYGKEKKNGAYEIITLNGGFHGRTLAMMAATAKPGWSEMYAPAIKGFKHLKNASLEELQKKTNPQTVAVMLELIQGEHGVYPLSHEFVKDVEGHCKKNNLLLIIDEIQTGMGRTGTILTSHAYNIKPNIVTLGKSLGGGFPLAAMLTREELNIFQPGEIGGTFGGQPLAMSCGKAVLKELKNTKFMENAMKVSASLQNGLKNFSLSKKNSTNDSSANKGTPLLSNLRGKGMMIGFDVAHNQAAALAKACFSNGLLVNAPRASSIRLLPPLTITQTDLKIFFEKFSAAYSSIV